MGRMDDWAEGIRRRQAFRRLPQEERQRLAFQKLGFDESLPGEALEHTVVLVESITETGAVDLERMPEASRKMWEPILLKKGMAIAGRSEGHPRPGGQG
jgi:hypothetical protein